MRPPTTTWRPSIRDLSMFLLSPQNQRRCLSKLSRQSRFPPPLRNQQYRLNVPRTFSLSSNLPASPKPKSHDRGPRSTEDTQTDFSNLNVLGNTPAPSTSIDACLWDGFHLDSGVKITGGTGVLLVAGEAFSWKPWEAGKGDKKMRLINDKGQWEVEDEAWGLLGLVWPKPGTLFGHVLGGMKAYLLGRLIDLGAGEGDAAD
jgi:NADH dehydrogenase [ubiquinone] 1 alpha subcomplex assembly factor 3